MDEKTKIISCSCGQENHLVLMDSLEPGTNRMTPTWHYDEKKHGNPEPCEGKCFNCHAPLEDDELFPKVVAKEPEIPQEPEPVEKPLSKMKKAELLEKAESLAIEVSPDAKKAYIIELIEEKRQDSDSPEE